MTRLTPFAHVFGELATTSFQAIQDEAGRSSTNLGDRAQFAKLPSVQRLLAEVADPGAVEAQPEAADEYLTSLFVAFRFWQAGQHVIAIDPQAVDVPLDRTRMPAFPAIPHGACYLQLPERWMWGQVDTAAPHEPVDGIFVSRSAAPSEITVLAVLGLRPGRPGFSQLAVRVTPEEMQAAPPEVRTPRFAPVIEGGREASLRSLVSVAELLLLVQLALAHIEE